MGSLLISDESLFVESVLFPYTLVAGPSWPPQVRKMLNEEMVPMSPLIPICEALQVVLIPIQKMLN